MRFVPSFSSDDREHRLIWDAAPINFEASANLEGVDKNATIPDKGVDNKDGASAMVKSGIESAKGILKNVQGGLKNVQGGIRAGASFLGESVESATDNSKYDRDGDQAQINIKNAGDRIAGLLDPLTGAGKKKEKPEATLKIPDTPVALEKPKAAAKTPDAPATTEKAEGTAAETPAAAEKTEGNAVETPATSDAAAEGTAEEMKLPDTKGEKLSQDFNNALEALSKAETRPEKVAAFLRVLGTMVAYILSALNGSFDDAINQPVSTEPAKDKTPEKKIEDTVREELKSDSGKGEKSENLEVKIDVSVDKKETEIKNNKEELKEYETEASGLEEENKTLIDQKGTIEKELTTLQDEKSPESMQKATRLEGQLRNMQSKIDLNKQRLQEIGTEKAKLETGNDRLQKEIDALTKIKDNVAKAVDTVTKLIAEKLKDKENSPFKGLTISISPNGGIVINIEGADQKLEESYLSLEKSKQGPAKDAKVGEIREDEEGNFWKKGEDKMWKSYNDAERKSDSGFANTKWSDSLMDEHSSKSVYQNEQQVPDLAIDTATIPPNVNVTFA